jgi:type VI secretion system protein ImpG
MLQNEALKKYFLSELAYLRGESTRFAREYPFVASELSLNRAAAKDPQVELLLQSFAFLTGQLRCELDRRATALPDQILDAVAPHLLLPLPSMAMAQLSIDPAGANFEHIQRSRSGAELSVELQPPNAGGLCRFQARSDLPLWPITSAREGKRLRAPSWAPPSSLPPGDCVAISLKTLGKTTLGQLPVASLRVQCIGDYRHETFDFLHRHVVGVSTRVPGKNPRRSPGRGINFAPWVGDQPMIPRPRPAHPGLALIQEYLAFPDRFLCFELSGLDFRGYGTEVELLLHLSEDAPDAPLEGFALNCIPIVNLFRRTLEPQPIVPGQEEYRLVGDAAHHATCEVHTVTELLVRDNSGVRTAVAPTDGDEPGAVPYWLARRELSQYPSIPGTELFVTVVAGPRLGVGSTDAALHGKALCTNRRLAQTLSCGDRLIVQGQPAAPSAVLVSQPSLYHVPEMGSDPTRHLTAQLTGEGFPTEGGARGLASLKELLTRHAFAGDTAAQAQIEALTAMRLERAAHRIKVGKRYGLSAGTSVSLTLDESRITDSSIAAFGEVLSAVLGHFAPINGSLQLTLLRADGSVFHAWPPLTGVSS